MPQLLLWTTVGNQLTAILRTSLKTTEALSRLEQSVIQVTVRLGPVSQQNQRTTLFILHHRTLAILDHHRQDIAIRFGMVTRVRHLQIITSIHILASQNLLLLAFQGQGMGSLGQDIPISLLTISNILMSHGLMPLQLHHQ